LLIALLAVLLAQRVGAQAKTPSTFLGIDLGADRTLADYHQILGYLKYLDGQSERVLLQPIGTSTRGEEMLAVVVSAPENLAALEQTKSAAAMLADPRGIAPARVAEEAQRAPVTVFIGCNLHSTEIASSQLVLEWVHELATSVDARRIEQLRAVVLVIVPSLNPDGQLMVVNWYRQHVGTPYEGSRMPWLYHPYVGHDNNRDFIMLTQKETRAINRAIYHEWHPQLIVDLHQMVGTGPRMFVPPYTDPVSPRIHPLVWRHGNLIGAEIAWRAERERKPGVVYGYWFDSFWPGALNTTAWFKNIPGFWLEIASARVATPVFVEPSELVAGRKGMIDYEVRTNYPNPWQGGWWRLRDIMRYQKTALDAILAACATHREAFLLDMAVRAADSAARGGERDAYRVPALQPFPATARRLIDTLREHRVDVLAEADGDAWIPLQQPFGAFVDELFEARPYPEVRPARGATPLPPYDVTAWALPLLMGVETERRHLPDEGLVPLVEWPSAPRGPGAFAAIRSQGAETARVINCALAAGATVAVSSGPAGPGTFYLETAGTAPCLDLAGRLGVDLAAGAVTPPDATGVGTPRVGLYVPWAASTDAGWAHWLLDDYGFAPHVLSTMELRSGKGLEALDVVALPDIEPATIRSGSRLQSGRGGLFPEPPPEYGGGIEESGAEALRRFVDRGGVLLAWNAAVKWVVEELEIPVALAGGDAGPGFSSPGALVGVTGAVEHPVTWGMSAAFAAFVDSSSPALRTSIPPPGVGRHVLATFAEPAGRLCLAGSVTEAGALAGKPAVVVVDVGRGHVVLLSFKANHRAQSHATIPLIFNTLFWSASTAR